MPWSILEPLVNSGFSTYKIFVLGLALYRLWFGLWLRLSLESQLGLGLARC